MREVAPDMPAPLRGLHFAEQNGQKFVELASLIGKVCGKRGDKCIKTIWRQLGQDEKEPQAEGVRNLHFSAVEGCARGAKKLAANLGGLQTVVYELGMQILENNKELLTAVARELGGELRLEPRHRRVELHEGVAVSVVMGDPPRMVLPVLVEAFGIKAARHYIEHVLIPHFVACGVHVERLSGVGAQPSHVNDQKPSLGKSRQLDIRREHSPGVTRVQ